MANSECSRNPVNSAFYGRLGASGFKNGVWEYERQSDVLYSVLELCPLQLVSPGSFTLRTRLEE